MTVGLVWLFQWPSLPFIFDALRGCFSMCYPACVVSFGSCGRLVGLQGLSRGAACVVVRGPGVSLFAAVCALLGCVELRMVFDCWFLVSRCGWDGAVLLG